MGHAKDENMLVCIIMLSLSMTSYGRYILLPETGDYVRLAMILKQFNQYDFVVHVEEARAQFLSRLGHETKLTNPVTIFKYTEDDYTFRRPAVTRCVHYIAEDDRLFFKHFAPVLGNINENDIVMFLTTVMDNINHTALYNTGVDNANMAFYVNLTQAYAVYFYRSPTIKAEAVRVDHAPSGDPLFSQHKNTFEDFQGFPVHIGYTDCMPFVYKSGGDLLGIEYKIMEMVVALLNITPTYIDYSGYNNSRNTLITDVNKTIIDCGIGCLSNTVFRNERVHFSAMLQAEPHITFYSSGDKYKSIPLHTIFKPLHGYVWLCCLLALLCLSVAIKILIKCEKKDSAVNSVLLPLSILLEQSSGRSIKGNALRFGLIIWMVVGYSLSSSYKSKLTAAMIQPTSREPVTLAELYREGYHFISPASDSTFVMEVLLLSDDPIEKRLSSEVEDTKDVCEATIRVANELSAIIEEQTVLRYTVWNYCRQNLTTGEFKAMRRMPDAMTVNGHVWALPKRAPYKNRVSYVLEVLKSYGLIQKWYKSYNISRPLPKSNTVRERGATEPLQPRDLVGAFVVLGLGCLFSGIAFSIERFNRRTP